ncbi:hypothetical protein ABZ471_32655 [Streptomyces sp. NPDC005728]|uniref:hypothetical protein n=1 Tax=Streptomyces sp. NPDC005728 TaxID=3157054 RepID=UPI0033DEE75D
MRSLVAAILSLFLPPRGAHRADMPPPLITCPSVPAFRLTSVRRTRPYPTDVIAADGLPLVRPYVVVWERERDEQERRYYAPWEAVV